MTTTTTTDTSVVDMSEKLKQFYKSKEQELLTLWGLEENEGITHACYRVHPSEITEFWLMVVQGYPSLYNKELAEALSACISDNVAEYAVGPQTSQRLVVVAQYIGGEFPASVVFEEDRVTVTSYNGRFQVEFFTPRNYDGVTKKVNVFVNISGQPTRTHAPGLLKAVLRWPVDRDQVFANICTRVSPGLY